MKEKWWQKWWAWLLITSLLMLIIQILFNIHPKSKWLDAVWEPGDLLTFIGTVVLGYIAVYQTKRANDTTERANHIAEQANQTSAQLIDLQQAEYTPVITVSKFAGLSYDNPNTVCVENYLSKPHSDLIVHEMRTTKNETIVGMSIALIEPGTKEDAHLFQRIYELHFKYQGKPVIKRLRILSVAFLGINYEKRFNIETSPDLSLTNGDEYNFFAILISNENYTVETNEVYKHITAPVMSITIEMKTMQGKSFVETITIHKHLVKQPDANFNKPNFELAASISYEVQEK